MEFKEGTKVKMANGDTVGTVDRIVIDPVSDEVTHIVVRKGFLFTEDRVIPIEDLSWADDETVLLSGSVEDFESFPLYEETYYVSPTGEYTTAPWSTWDITPLYYYPPAGMGFYPYSPIAHNEPKVAQHTRNVPDDTVVISKGTTVTTRDGENAGHVEETFTNSEGQVTHILISKGLFFTTERLVPVHWVRWTSDDEIRLNVPNEVVENLPEFAH